jgi:hypothetical protein
MMAANDTPEGGINSKDAALALALARGLTIARAAKTAGVSEATAYRRLREEPFRQTVRDLRTQMTAEAVGVLAAASADAARTLTMLATKSKREEIALAAARAVLDQAARLREQTDLAQELADLRAMVEGRNHEYSDPADRTEAAEEAGGGTQDPEAAEPSGSPASGPGTVAFPGRDASG